VGDGAPILGLPFRISGIPDSGTGSGISASGIRNPTNLESIDEYAGLGTALIPTPIKKTRLLQLARKSLV
jgi:hypothetical protein